MNFITSRLKRFDVHVKTVDSVNQQTLIGAFVTICCVAVVCILTTSEISTYLEKDTINHLVMDQSNGSGDVILKYEVEFLNIPCSLLAFSQEVVRGTVHAQSDPGKVELAPLFDNGCNIKGHLVTDKVAGNFKFNYMGDYNVIPPDLSHTIRQIDFIPKETQDQQGLLYNTSKTLNGQQTTVAAGIGMYHFNIQIVPIHYEKSTASFLPWGGAADGGNYEVHMNEYSVTEREIHIADLGRGMSLGGTLLKDFCGVIFTYDFYPMTVVVEESRESIFQFMTSLCAIIGGVITILSLVDRCLHQSVKALIGKKD